MIVFSLICLVVGVALALWYFSIKPEPPYNWEEDEGLLNEWAREEEGKLLRTWSQLNMKEDGWPN